MPIVKTDIPGYKTKTYLVEVVVTELRGYKQEAGLEDVEAAGHGNGVEILIKNKSYVHK